MAKLLTHLPSALDQDVSGSHTASLPQCAVLAPDPVQGHVVRKHLRGGRRMAAGDGDGRLQGGQAHRLINCGCMAFNVEPVDFDAVPA